MNIGEQINELRKRNHLSQDEFANIFNVTRQTVSNWENGKSYPDLEVIIQMSEHFHVSIDEILKNDQQGIKKIDNERKKGKKYLILLIIVILCAGLICGIMYSKYSENTSVDFSMKKGETYENMKNRAGTLEIANGYFTVPKEGNVNIDVKGDIDDGKLHIDIFNQNKNKCYQLDGQYITDTQKIYLEKGSYIIQVTADDYKEDVVSMEYDIKINNWINNHQ